MVVLWYLFIVLGIQGIAYPLQWAVLSNYYKNNSEVEKTQHYKNLEVIFKHKCAMAVIITLDIIFWAAAIVIFAVYGSTFWR